VFFVDVFDVIKYIFARFRRTSTESTFSLPKELHFIQLTFGHSKLIENIELFLTSNERYSDFFLDELSQKFLAKMFDFFIIIFISQKSKCIVGDKQVLELYRPLFEVSSEKMLFPFDDGEIHIEE
jgi:hypothetical protein